MRDKKIIWWSSVRTNREGRKMGSFWRFLPLLMRAACRVSSRGCRENWSACWVTNSQSRRSCSCCWPSCEESCWTRPGSWRSCGCRYWRGGESFFFFVVTLNQADVFLFLGSLCVMWAGDDPSTAGAAQSSGAAGDGGSGEREVQQAGGGKAVAVFRFGWETPVFSASRLNCHWPARNCHLIGSSCAAETEIRNNKGLKDLIKVEANKKTTKM